MASYLKSIDGNHLVEAGLEGFYGQSKTESNPNFHVGTDFIANNQIPTIDFATLHSYPDQWFEFLFKLFFYRTEWWDLIQLNGSEKKIKKINNRKAMAVW